LSSAVDELRNSGVSRIQRMKSPLGIEGSQLPKWRERITASAAVQFAGNQAARRAFLAKDKTRLSIQNHGKAAESGYFTDDE